MKLTSLALSLSLLTGVAAMAQDVRTLDNATLSGDETIETPIGVIELQDNFVTDASVQALFDEMDYQRAVQSFIWAAPLVGYKQWQIAQNEAFEASEVTDFAVLVSLNEKGGILTPNLTTPYVINFTNLAEGPVFIEVPAAPMAGMLMDAWQRPVADIGQTGPDKGEGGTYLIVGPEDDLKAYEGEADFVLQSATNNLFIGVRILDASPEAAEAVKAGLKLARHGEEPRPATPIIGKDPVWSATPPRGLGYWEVLHAVLQEEPVREQDKVWMAMLEPLGIKKGEPFAPDERQAKILTRGATMGELMLRNMQTNPRFAEPWWEGTSWYKSFDFTVPQITDERVELDERGVWFYEAVTSSEGMVNPKPGVGQVYMTTKRDANGELVRADKTYKLSVPADAPVSNFWSLTLYSEDTRRPYDNGGTEVTDASLDSRMEQLQRNDDGSVDLFIGPSAPEGMESNHLATAEDDGWFVYFRLYGPEEAFFDKSFALPDLEPVN
ncbi:hypothetical protein JM93_01143 [Roseibium hamelinense]|uniref:DUF1254 domain-containing protein n=1 Tax=Roseibium hamelinense TaxID=150831 RepID=A0A562TB82_9HYPH|nr:DUF1254 domain-containing protein [Roseibium hamelinense]MTI45460.1 DUF1254 domain-containing protein [Roseibium hamelinense]TWI90166.1 hypothetical protein JM93_01143 [Roseibium hamelinense]